MQITNYVNIYYIFNYYTAKSLSLCVIKLLGDLKQHKLKKKINSLNDWLEEGFY